MSLAEDTGETSQNKTLYLMQKTDRDSSVRTFLLVCESNRAPVAD